MERLAGEAVEDAAGYISDIQEQREASLEPLGMTDLIYATTVEIETRYQQLLADESADAHLQMQCAILAYYLSFRTGAAFKSFFGAWDSQYERFPNSTGALAHVLDFLRVNDVVLYEKTWATIVDAMERATAPAERQKHISIPPQKYTQLIRTFDMDSEYAFNPTKNRQAYESAVTYKVKYNGCYFEHTLKLSHRQIIEGKLTDAIFDELGLNRFDQSVMEVVCTCYEKRERINGEKREYVIIPYLDIARLVFQCREPSPVNIQAVQDSCEKMRRTFIRIDFEREAQMPSRRSKQQIDSYIDGYLLSYYGTALEVKSCGAVVPCLILNGKPLLKQWGEIHRQIQRYRIPTGETAKKIAAATPKYTVQYKKLQQAVNHKVLLMKRCAVSERDKRIKQERKKGYSNAPSAMQSLDVIYSPERRTLNIEDIYAECGAQSKQQKRTVRASVESVLKQMVLSEDIAGYSQSKIGQKVVGYVIQIEPKE